VGITFFFDARSVSGVLATVAKCFGINRSVTMCQRFPGNSHSLGFYRNRFQSWRNSSSSFGLNVSLLATVAALDVNHHPFGCRCR